MAGMEKDQIVTTLPLPKLFIKGFNATKGEDGEVSKAHKDIKDISPSCFEKTSFQEMNNGKTSKSKITATEQLVGRVSEYNAITQIVFY